MDPICLGAVRAFSLSGFIAVTCEVLIGLCASSPRPFNVQSKGELDAALVPRRLEANIPTGLPGAARSSCESV